MIRVAIVDDHKIVVSGLKTLIEFDGRMRVVGTANDVRSGLAVCAARTPDVIILDLRMPDSRGIVEVSAFREANPAARILVLTGFGDEAKAQALENGADAFMTKELASEAIVEQISSWFPWTRHQNPLAILSDREREVGRLAVSGLTNPEISEKLFISVNTVKTHLARILEKLDVRDRTELARHWPEPP